MTQIIGSMCNTNSDWEYQKFLFQMTISVAHEIMHFFTSFLTGDGRPVTPRQVGVVGYPGEIGHLWERIAIGGHIEFYSNPQPAITSPRAGTPFIFTNMSMAAYGKEVPERFVRRFVEGRE